MYEDDDVRCFCGLRASRRISRTEANPNRKFFGCPLYYSAVTFGLFQYESHFYDSYNVQLVQPFPSPSYRLPEVVISSSGMIGR
ncbi:hypothetical protein LINPERPRIM_LOCUS141 [Linum perenne]